MLKLGCIEFHGNFVSSSLSSFRMFLYAGIACLCLQFCFTKAYKKCGRDLFRLLYKEHCNEFMIKISVNSVRPNFWGGHLLISDLIVKPCPHQHINHNRIAIGSSSILFALVRIFALGDLCRFDCDQASPPLVGRLDLDWKWIVTGNEVIMWRAHSLIEVRTRMNAL